MGENGEICHFLGRTRESYRYQRVVPVPIVSEGLVPVPVKVVPGPLLPATLFFHIFAPLSPIFIHQLFRDPKKLLMGVQIRMRQREKHIVPCRLGEAIFVKYE